ncbi:MULTISPECIES: ANTAR domain-containing protein [Streptomyces]|uniref:ANTAR domain-containing protein n=2 Tax=Streptomyces rimosus subsp. rimosus TaxID=132474 RepID=A0A8A1UZ70_STRR1|nr:MULTISPECIES: ANTAR domain-containing protein [Streptomyces]QDA02957.1 ANTAR domain-containing protein [Streptomyces rimosus]QGY66051.1 ANTAR domain-containing protein [Streptomyces rimosus R6-500]QST85019.1 ANTAR domain-containing protein [Streptomyces rimosus subsp. rimosus ATCC 10970]QTL85038.1 ANTAR domain-containing protein [Streptomyces rimosus subsp. rimosus]UNZ01197.1 ANTAR domain protein [Streptomyces rimosus subsp. rimosus]
MPSPPRDPPASPLMTALLDTLGSPPGLGLLPADRCAQALGLTCVTISARAGGHAPELIWSAPDDRLGTALEDVQFTLGEGPTLGCLRDGRTVTEPDLSRVAGSRWPTFLPEALQAGARALFALPLAIGAVRLGAFTGYRTRPGPLTLQQHLDMHTFIDTATFLLLALLPGADGRRDPATDLATLHRAEIHQATGMLAVRLHLPLDQALLLLRSHAYSTGRPILDLARDIIDHRNPPGLTGPT